MKVTAEGVETREALAALQLMGCDLAQGYSHRQADGPGQAGRVPGEWSIELPAPKETRQDEARKSA
jgi:EAL domain-containing protein (putative c-di-GMP-specific phosphodiesterase class I)